MNLSNALRENQIESEFLPRYSDMVQAGIVFGVTYSAAAIAAPSATATGSFALFNPAASGVQLVLLKATVPIITFTAGTTGAAFGFQLVANQQPSATTPGNTPQNMLVGSAKTSGASAFTAGTLVGAPTVAGYWIDSAYLDLAAGDVSLKQSEIDGALIINPNSGVDIVMSGTLTATVAPSLVWAEVPLG
jgi:hypothetical protein